MHNQNTKGIKEQKRTDDKDKKILDQNKTESHNIQNTHSKTKNTINTNLKTIYQTKKKYETSSPH